LLRGACPEHLEILRYAQNDRRRRARNDTPSVIARSGNDEAIPIFKFKTVSVIGILVI